MGATREIQYVHEVIDRLRSGGADLQVEATMDTNRRIALSAGVLFIVATAAVLSATALSQPILDHSDYMTRLTAGAGQVNGAALLNFVAAVASAGIAISLYPVLRRWNVGLALGSVVFRTMEALLYIAGVVSLLSLVDLSRHFTDATPAARLSLQAIGDSLLSLRQEASVAAVLAFSLGALMYYYLFYRSRLIPRWLSGWGIVAIILIALACVLAWFSHNPITGYVILALPIAVQEIVLALWLIARGFNPAAFQ
jgi:hypothetical protein